jgi:phage head maturation protease
MDNWLIQPVRDAVANQSVDGMSFRFTVVREEWREADGKLIRDEDKVRELLRRSWMEEVPDEELLTRTLKELRVPELGPVVCPAYAETSVGVRSMLDRLSASERHVLAQHAQDLTESARSADGDNGDRPGNGPPPLSTRHSVDTDALRLRGILR